MLKKFIGKVSAMVRLQAGRGMHGENAPLYLCYI